MNIIGDIAGNYKTLIALLKKMPDHEVISLGDMIDRGPRSKEVLDFFMSQGRAVLGNHEHMLVDLYKAEMGFYKNQKPYYREDIWFRNGGLDTCKSFKDDFSYYDHKVSEIIDEKYIRFLEGLPFYIKEKGLFLSHAPKSSSVNLDEVSDLGHGFYYDFGFDPKSEASLLWYRGVPSFWQDILQIHGHNAWKDVLCYNKENPSGVFLKELGGGKCFAYDIDTSKAKVLTGYNSETKQFYQQEYID